MPKKIILDVDVGTDDAFALLMLLRADKEKQVEILGITCVNGNTSLDNCYKNVRRLLKITKREDIPVFLGAHESLLENNIKNYFHGKDGLGDLEYEVDDVTPCDNVHNKTKIEFACGEDNPEKNNIKYGDVINETAISAMNRLVCKYPKEVSLICLAPLTNVAIAMKMHAEFTENIKDIYIMGGNHKGVGNVTPSAEFNFHTDPEAAFIVLNSKRPLVILPWEPCKESNITSEWRKNVLGKLNHPALKLLNAAEYRIYSDDEELWWPCDVFLIALFLDSDIVLKQELHNVSVEVQGSITRGQMVLDHIKSKIPNANVVTEINYDLFKQMLCDSLND